MAAKQVIIAVAVLAVLAGVCRAIQFNNPESYWCNQLHVSRVALDGPVELSQNNDDLCKEACKQEKQANRYLPGNWAVFDGVDQVKCCCAVRKPTFSHQNYYIQKPSIAVGVALERASDVKELDAYYDGLQKAQN